MTASLATVLAALAVFSAAPTSPTSASDNLTGTWSVTIKPGEVVTCPTLPEAGVHQWLLAVNGDSVTVEVIGETRFKKLAGKIDGDRITLFAEAPARNDWGTVTAGGTSLWVLTLAKDLTATGTRYTAAVERSLACVISWSVSAKKL